MSLNHIDHTLSSQRLYKLTEAHSVPTSVRHPPSLPSSSSFPFVSSATNPTSEAEDLLSMDYRSAVRIHNIRVLLLFHLRP